MSVQVTTSSVKTGTDDGFYENLTLGLMKVLNNVPRIANVVCEKRLPCERGQITTWEQRHNVYLADDMKKFYLSTDGFILNWSYQYSPNDVRRVGHINFPHLLQIALLRENVENLIATQINLTKSTPSSAAQIMNLNNDNYTSNNNSSNINIPTLNSRTKIFELSNICDIAKVCLIYESTDILNPKIYLLEMETYRWQFLAETFTEYLRMTIAHLGLPYWELCFSSCGLPSWTEQLFLLLAPHLLEKNEARRNRITPSSIQEQPPYNTLDTSIFRTKPKCSRQVQKSR